MQDLFTTFVVFTGPAQTRAGDTVIRADLKTLAERKGYTVQSTVSPRTQVLVASRSDAVKARRAFEQGIEVLTYGAFIDKLGGGVPKTGVKPDNFVDHAPKPELVDAGEDWL